MSLAGRSAMDRVEMLYSRQVFVYNDHVIKGGVLPSLVELFSDITSSLDDKVSAKLPAYHTQFSKVAGKAVAL